MFEYLSSLRNCHRILDLGSASGSFDSTITRARVFRVDLEACDNKHGGCFVRADSAALPFRAECFDIIVANHSLEHFVELEAARCEIGRVIKAGGTLFVSVPDASTLSDRIYRWLGRGGGHVNAFVHEDELPRFISEKAKIPHTGTVLLHSGLSFMNRGNIKKIQKKLWLLGGGYEGVLRFATFSFRWLDHELGTRLSVYGWAYYFGAYCPADKAARTNVCIRCGSGHRASALLEQGLFRRLIFPAFFCANCGAENFFTTDLS
jgi:SAM-dependent methyltransferase